LIALFPFASRSFLANNLRFKVKAIDKEIVINVKIHKNERKRLYSSISLWSRGMAISADIGRELRLV
jgi:hypothetical protein